MKILVTGAAGFIGFHLCRRLLERGFEVVGLDSINDYYDVRLKFGRLRQLGIEVEPAFGQLLESSTQPGFRFLRARLEDAQAVEALFARERFDKVCHLAAQAGVRYSIENPRAYVDSNLVGFFNVLDCARKFEVKHFVYASSSSVYGLNEHVPFSTGHNVDHPVSLYAASKKANELLAHSYSHLFGLPTTGLRFFTVYGPWGRPDMALALFAEAIFNDKPIRVFNHGAMHRDFTYIDDIVAGLERVIDKDAQPDPDWSPQAPKPNSSSAPYRIYNIGNSQSVNLMDFIQAIERQIGKTAQKIMLDMQPGDVVRTWADVSDLASDTGYRPSTSIEEGIRHYIDWYRDFYKR